jgi:hypothetical protein
MATAPAPATQKPRIRRGYNPGVCYVESRTRPGKVHMVNTRYLHCSCEAGKRRMRCWHITYCVALDDWRRRQQGTAR